MHFLADQEDASYVAFSLLRRASVCYDPNTGSKVHRWIEAELIGQADRPAVVQTDKRLG